MRRILLLLLLFVVTPTATAEEVDAERYTVNQIVNNEKAPTGVIFAVREYDEDALVWVLPRVEKYMREIRKNHPDISIAMMSHGDELVSLSNTRLKEYNRMHKLLKKLVTEENLRFHICGTMAEMNGLGVDDFPEYVDVVPFGPSQVEDYINLGYVLIDLELTW